MAFTAAQRESLAAAIASGVQTVTFNTRTVTYHSLEQMRMLLADMDRQLLTTTRAYRLGMTAKMGHPTES